jgi:hypothetical protein
MPSKCPLDAVMSASYRRLSVRLCRSAGGRQDRAGDPDSSRSSGFPQVAWSDVLIANPSCRERVSVGVGDDDDLAVECAGGGRGVDGG